MKVFDRPSYKSDVLYLIAALSLFRMVLAPIIGLGNDESYYWLYTQHLQLNYFDHPPVVAIWTRLFTLNGLLPDHTFFLRLGSVTGCALATWFMYKTVAQLHSERAGFFAAGLYNASFYSGLTAGLYLMPDAPQMVFWTFALWMLACITTTENRWKYWLLFGMSAGLCIMSKVHGVFLWGGLGLYILLFKRAWFAKPQLYISALITLFIISPIFIWNIRYDFVTYRFHSNRVIIDEVDIQFSFLRELGGQISFNNPVNVGLVFLGLWQLWKRKLTRLPALQLFNFIGLPLALMLIFISFFRDTTLPHWSGPAYVSLLPLAAIQLASLRKPTVATKIFRSSISVFIIALTGWCLVVHFYPGTFGKKEAQVLGTGDISLDFYGWRKAAKSFEAIYKNEVSKGVVPAGTPLVCTYWWGAHIEYYFARPLGIPMIGLGNMNEIRHYLWTNDLRKMNTNADAAFCIMPVDEQYKLPFEFYRQAQFIATIEIARNGKPAHNFWVYRLRGLKKPVPSIPWL